MAEKSEEGRVRRERRRPEVRKEERDLERGRIMAGNFYRRDAESAEVGELEKCWSER